MLSRKSAFTMAETLVAIGLIGVLAGFLIPAMKDFAPDKNKTMAKKAVNVAERIIYEMYNDDELYPRIGVDGETEYVGFDNTERVVYMGNAYGGTTEVQKKTKFCRIFIRKLSTKSDAVSCTGIAPGSGPDQTNAPTFTTEDGMAWFLPKTDFNPPLSGTGTTKNKVNYMIYVDVNGPKQPNCKIETCPSNGDIFTIAVTAYGDIDLWSDTDEAQDKILRSDTLFKKD